MRDPILLTSQEGDEFDAHLEITGVRSTAGRVRLVDALAAGEAYWKIEFLDGPLVGRQIWIYELHGAYWYRINLNSDGFLINWSDLNEESEGGDVLPDWNRAQVRITPR